MRNTPPTTGYIAAFRIAGIRIYVHWTFPAAGIALAFMLGDMSGPTLLSAVIAYTLLILLHEAGHAYFALRAGCAVHGLIVSGAGGMCIADTPRTRRDLLLFLAGGLLAQLLAFVATVGILMVTGSPDSRVAGSFALVFTVVNAVIFVFNLIPHANNDGAMIVAALGSRRRG